MTIRHIDDSLKARLRVRAALHGRSMEDEARDILRAVLSTELLRPRDLGQAIHERFMAQGGVSLPEVPREMVQEPRRFGRVIVPDTNRISEMMRPSPDDHV